MNEPLQIIIKNLVQFRDKRNWQKYHTPENLAQSVSIEAAELLECFQWGKAIDKGNIAMEIADIAIYLLYLCHDLGLDIVNCIDYKIHLNSLKYPEGESHEW